MKSMRTVFADHVPVMLAVLLGCGAAYAQSEWVVHSFNTPFGAVPLGNLVADGEGNLYGTTHTGGTKDWGVVYELVRPVPPKTAWTETVLYNFTGNPDGGKPEAGLIFDKLGSLYGTTNLGGSAGEGTVFELSPPVTPDGAWTESVLHSFTPDSGDGRNPDTGLTWDHSGNLIGVTSSGGINTRSACRGPCGTVFELSPSSTPGGAWTETILQNFKWGLGVQPRGTPVVAANGVLYGTTYGGGVYGYGVAYKLQPPSVENGEWTYRVLHAFKPLLGTPEGGYPMGALTLHGRGVLYGATFAGAYGGTVFQLVPPVVPGGAWTENVLYGFGTATGDGHSPAANIIFDAAGNIYGTTSASGSVCSSGCGTVFQLSPPISSGGDWTETVLHSFGEGNDGSSVAGGLILGKNGVLFGVTRIGGTKGQGTVFAVVK